MSVLGQTVTHSKHICAQMVVHMVSANVSCATTERHSCVNTYLHTWHVRGLSLQEQSPLPRSFVILRDSGQPRRCNSHLLSKACFVFSPVCARVSMCGPVGMAVGGVDCDWGAPGQPLSQLLHMLSLTYFVLA